MTLRALPTPVLYPGFGNTNNSTLAFSTSTYSAGQYYCLIFRAREAMTISHVYFRCAAATGSPTADIRIETVDLATGLPSGTLWATNTNIVTGTLTAAGAIYALTAAAIIAAGDYVAVKIAHNSGTSFGLGVAPFSQVAQSAFPYGVSSGTKFAITNNGANVAIGSSSTSFYQVPGIFPAQASSGSISGSISNATFDAFGMRFRLPFKTRCRGIQTTINSSSYGEFKYGIYDDAGAEVGSSETTGFDKDLMGVQANGPHLVLPFDSPTTLLPDTWYRAALWPTSATAFVIHTYGAFDTNIKAVLPGGNDWHFTRKAIGGAWNDTFVNEALVMNLVLDQFDDGVGGGGTSFSPLLAA